MYQKPIIYRKLIILNFYVQKTNYLHFYLLKTNYLHFLFTLLFTEN